MQVCEFVEKIRKLGIEMITGVPDSALKPFCDYMNEQDVFIHYVPANEGAAVGIALGNYLATGKPACIYAQNSGLGNMVNPITSLANEAVYGIPMLLLIGWRGKPGTKDEPQHKFMGNITEDICEVLDIEHVVLEKEMDKGEINRAFEQAGKALSENKQFAFVINRNFFETVEKVTYQNEYSLIREDAIREILYSVQETDVLVSTTGKISRELYEQSDMINGHHKQDFLTVGGMGHASMIAFGIAQARPEKQVYCLDGDGAVFMHMGSLAFLGKQKPDNLIHICLNNEAHESVGGMPTGCVGLKYATVAEQCGYPLVYTVEHKEQLHDVLAHIRKEHKLAFVEVRVGMQSRDDLGRPKETAKENKINFMEYHGG